MGLFQRISDIISANLSELAEEFEDPETMLKQAVREMDDSIQQATTETARTLAHEKKLAKELAHNESEARRWHTRAEQAVQSGDDDLARKALSRKQEHDKLAVALRDQLAAAQAATRTLRHQLDGMKAKLSEAKRNLATLSARNRAAAVRKKVYARGLESTVDLDETAFAKFDRLRERVEQAEAEAEALAELQGFDVESAAAEDSPEPHADIEAQLEMLKKKSRG